MTDTVSGAAGRVAAAVNWQPPPNHAWTKDFVRYALRDADVTAITERVVEGLTTEHVSLPDVSNLVRRCVHALLVGHLVLQGPPGTGKTTLARALAEGFRVQLEECTATSDWTPFHVVGGFRPSLEGGLVAAYGKVPQAVVMCAERVRSDVEGTEPDEAPQATWLLIDEFNRADIDKAIGSLYTVLSTCDPDHLEKTPIDLWFESETDARQLWVPARFRIIAAMNDLDTTFVNRMSQGLTRRFQFVTIGVPSITATDALPVTDELQAAFAGALDWLRRTYGAVLSIPSESDALNACHDAVVRLQQVVDGLRRPPSGAGWPLGTAQIVDVFRIMLSRYVVDANADLTEALDDAVSSRIVPQMAGVDDDQVEAFTALFNEHAFTATAQELRHLVNPHEIQ